eukprot:scaffold95498_cov19-Tisochrysis_lutea.AAC.1
MQVLMYRLMWVSEAVKNFQDQYSPHASTRHYELFIKAEPVSPAAGTVTLQATNSCCCPLSTRPRSRAGKLSWAHMFTPPWWTCRVFATWLCSVAGHQLGRWPWGSQPRSLMFIPPCWISCAFATRLCFIAGHQLGQVASLRVRGPDQGLVRGTGQAACEAAGCCVCGPGACDGAARAGGCAQIPAQFFDGAEGDAQVSAYCAHRCTWLSDEREVTAQRMTSMESTLQS